MTLDFQQLLREIDDEVRARRASGDFPPGMERELDLVFARFAPPTINADDLDGLLEAVDRSSYIDPDPPTASRVKPVALLKRVERKLLGWFFRFIAQQVTAFGGVVVQTFRHIGRRIEALEAAAPGANRAQTEAALRAIPPAAVASLADAVAAHLAGTTGRVLVLEAGDGALVGRLADLDVYGVEPRAELAEAATLAGLDVRDGEALDHLAAVDDDALAGLVLTGVVDRSPVGVQLALLDRVSATLTTGGRLAVVSVDPARWGVDNPIEADLSPGRPLRPATWVHLLEESGYRDVTVVDGDGLYAVTAVR